MMLQSLFRLSAAAAAAAREVAARDHPAADQDEAEDHADRMEVRRQSALPAQCIAAVRATHLVVLAVIVARALLRALARQRVAGVRQRAMSRRGVHDRRRARRCDAAKPWYCGGERYSSTAARRHRTRELRRRAEDKSRAATRRAVRAPRGRARMDRQQATRPRLAELTRRASDRSQRRATASSRCAPSRCPRQPKAPPPMTGPASR